MLIVAKIIEFVIPFDQDLQEYLAKNYQVFDKYQILGRSLDARKAPKGRKPKIHYRIRVLEGNEEFEEKSFPRLSFNQPPIIVGAGPAGLFCALRLKEYGIKSILLERGDRALERMKKISKHWRYGKFDEESNVCFGEGGAGLFSDGKLLTRVKSPLVHYVLDRLVGFGAPEHIKYESNPHLGSNKIREFIGKVTDELIEFGTEVHYNTRVDDILLEDNKIVGVEAAGNKFKSSQVVLATGHSAKGLYLKLHEHKVPIVLKDFAVGVRVEHPRKYINSIQFGKYAGDERLGAARYRISYFDKEVERGTYSFCMCPGGYVLSSGTDSDGLVTNGMSNYAHNSPWSNAAIVVTVDKAKDLDSDHSLAGMDFLRKIEQKAYQVSKEYSNGFSLPAITMSEFLKGELNQEPLPKSSCPSKLFKHDLAEIFPDFIIKQLRKALVEIDKKIPGFIYKDALLIAPETRTSAPLTITRKKDFQSLGVKGLFPCGEGAGYAGGITSAAVDGVKVADALVSDLL